MLQLRAYATPDRADEVAATLGPINGVRHVVVGRRTLSGMIEVTGDVESEAADAVLDVLRGFDLGSDDVTLWRAASVQPLGWRRRKGMPRTSRRSGRRCSVAPGSTPDPGCATSRTWSPPGWSPGSGC